MTLNSMECTGISPMAVRSLCLEEAGRRGTFTVKRPMSVRAKRLKNPSGLSRFIRPFIMHSVLSRERMPWLRAGPFTPLPMGYTRQNWSCLYRIVKKKKMKDTRRSFLKKAGTLLTVGAAGPHLWIKKGQAASNRSEEHTSELQSRENLVC